MNSRSHPLIHFTPLVKTVLKTKGSTTGVENGHFYGLEKIALTYFSSSKKSNPSKCSNKSLEMLNPSTSDRFPCVATAEKPSKWLCFVIGTSSLVLAPNTQFTAVNQTISPMIEPQNKPGITNQEMTPLIHKPTPQPTQPGGGEIVHMQNCDYAMHKYAQLCTIVHNHAHFCIQRNWSISLEEEKNKQGALLCTGGDQMAAIISVICL